MDGFRFEGEGFDAIPAGSSVEDADPVFRFYNERAGGHFFTTSEQERDAVKEMDGFRFEGEGFQAFDEQVEGTTPVFRFYNEKAGGHFFTTSLDEADSAGEISGFRFEGIGFYAFGEDFA